jgi:hypothetical protein
MICGTAIATASFSPNDAVAAGNGFELPSHASLNRRRRRVKRRCYGKSSSPIAQAGECLLLIDRLRSSMSE